MAPTKISVRDFQGITTVNPLSGVNQRMSIRRLLRGQLSEAELEGIAAAAAGRQGDTLDSLRLLNADNWLSTPTVVNEKLFVKIISAQNTLVHGLLTTGRNLGAFTSGTEGFFERFGTPLGMAEHELEATQQMRQLGVNAPDPIEAFEYEGYGVLVLEYLPAFETIESVDQAEAEAVTDALFESLATMHAAGLVHGDLRGENVLVMDGELYFIDATNVRDDAIADARAYDIACALAVLEPIVGADSAVRAAGRRYDDDVLLAAESFLDFVSMRPDHDFDVLKINGEIEKLVSGSS
jgi:serine/threonine protein kinase